MLVSLNTWQSDRGSRLARRGSSAQAERETHCQSIRPPPPTTASSSDWRSACPALQLCVLLLLLLRAIPARKYAGRGGAGRMQSTAVSANPTKVSAQLACSVVAGSGDWCWSGGGRQPARRECRLAVHYLRGWMPRWCGCVAQVGVAVDLRRVWFRSSLSLAQENATACCVRPSDRPKRVVGWKHRTGSDR